MHWPMQETKSQDISAPAASIPFFFSYESPNFKEVILDQPKTDGNGSRPLLKNYYWNFQNTLLHVLQ